MLHVYNFDSWCSVSVNGGAFSSTGTQTVCIAPGSIPLQAKASSSTFELGSDTWVYVSGTGGTTTGTAGSVSSGVSSESVAVGDSPGCVLVCCPFSSDGSGCDSAFTGYTTWTHNCE